MFLSHWVFAYNVSCMRPRRQEQHDESPAPSAAPESIA